MVNSTFINNTSDRGAGGAAYVQFSSATIDACIFDRNKAIIGPSIAPNSNAVSSGGGVYCILCSIALYNNVFLNNTADFGGGAYTGNASGLLKNATFVNNRALESSGGGVHINQNSSVTIEQSTFQNNSAFYDGGGVYVEDSKVRIESCMFLNSTTELTDNSSATQTKSKLHLGGAVFCSDSEVMFINNTFRNSTSQFGGALAFLSSNVSINDGIFLNNVAQTGSAMYALCSVPPTLCSPVTMTLIDTEFTGNVAILGSAIHIDGINLNTNGYFNILNNTGVMNLLNSNVSLSGTTTISNNYRSLVAVSSEVVFAGQTFFFNNSLFNSSKVNPEHTWDIEFIWEHALQEGGAVTGFQSELYFTDTVNLTENRARYGGAILAKECKIYMLGDITVSNNKASVSGGGIRAYQTELNFKNHVRVNNNTATKQGGGISAISSSIRLSNGSLHLTNNNAERGGGMALELYARLYIIKAQIEVVDLHPDSWLDLQFSNNSADFGGAVYVSDETNSGTCSSTAFALPTISSSECFFQAVFLYTRYNITLEPNLRNIYFTNNSARVGGRALFGGLLDRCTVNNFAEVFSVKSLKLDGTSYLTNVTNLNKSDFKFEISSYPIRVCFCKDGKPDCSFQPPPKYVMKGEAFSLSVVAVDQVNNTIASSTIRSYLSSSDSRLGEGQTSQLTNENCSLVKYNAFSPKDNETLFLYAEGPCNNSGTSQRYIKIEFLPCECPIGFEPDQDVEEVDNCACVCESQLAPYVTRCFHNNQSLLREGDFWITSKNFSNENESEIFINPHCPFDYCYPPTKQVYVNLNIHNGTDAQCAFNRSGVMCGSCPGNLSLTLGSSHCQLCSNYWVLLLIPFAIAGIALVAFLLVCNLTVGEGTINGLIYYANIVVANSTAFLPFEGPNFFTVFIAWLNLDFGFETCFFNGMDGYVKVWLQLAFPVYIIFLVAMIIVYSERSDWFSNLINRTNPVATLATLILLSYTKLLRTIIAALSFTRLTHPDGSHETAAVWLYDANVPYLRGKHIFLFIAAVLILFLGLAYTVLLLFWQWLLRLPNWRILRWCNSTRLHSFMDVYHAPYHQKSRYWTGLLLLTRVLLYLISALDHIIGDPNVKLTTISIVTICILTFKAVCGGKVIIYKEWPLDVLESSFVLNLLLFSVATQYVSGSNGNQVALAYTSIVVAFVTFLGIIIYHMYRFTIKNVLPHCPKKSTPRHLCKCCTGCLPRFYSRRNFVRLEEPHTEGVTERDNGYSIVTDSGIETFTQSEINGLPSTCNS